MSNYNAKMHQIRFPHSARELTALPERDLAVFYGIYSWSSNEREEREVRQGMEIEDRRKGKDCAVLKIP